MTSRPPDSPPERPEPPPGSIDLEEHERHLVVRPMQLEDFDALVAMQALCFPGMTTWKRAQIESQLRRFPEGQVVVELDGELVASSSSLIVEFAEHEDWHDWGAISDHGFIRNHTPDGDTLYGIEMMVHPSKRGMRLSRRLYEERKRLCRERNLERIIIGGRLPGYGAVAERLSAAEYVEAVMRKALHDPVLTAQLANGFTLKRLIPGYMPSDEASRGYATFLEWANLDHVPARQRRFQAVRMVRLAVVQFQVREVDDFGDFARQVAFFCDVASENRADFVVFPELLTVELLSYMKAQRPGLDARALAALTPGYLDLLRELALKHDVNVLGGSQFTLEGDRLLNVAYLFRRDGTLERQPKLHPTQSERKWWGLEGGDRLDVFETDRGRVAILVGNDVEVPELGRIAAAKGADLLLVPFTSDERSAFLRVKTCAQARAIENDVYVATAGVVGNLPFVNNADLHFACSGVYTPSDFAFPRDGIAVESPENVETVTFCDVDLEVLRRHRQVGTAPTWADRRPELYRVAWDEDGTTRTV